MGTAEAGAPDGGGVGGIHSLEISLVVWTGEDGALSLRSRCLIETREIGRDGGVDDVSEVEIGVGGRGRRGGGKGEVARAWGIVGRGSECGGWV